MTDSETSAHHDDSDEDIYKDFPEFNLEEELAKLEGSKEVYKQEALDLSAKVKLLSEENAELKKLNEVLGRNFSTLLKTAQAEVRRKDSLIEELRSKVDSFTFRRNNKSSKDKFTTTEDLQSVNNIKSECLECKNNRNKKRSKSCELRTSSESECKSSKDDKRKSERDCSKEESKDCDNDRRLGHFRENLKLNFRRSESDHDMFIEKQRGSQFDRYSRKESILGRRSYRQDVRHYSKYNSIDKRKHSTRSNELRFSPRRRDSKERRNDRRDGSLEKSRRSDARRNRSRSRDRSLGRKECTSDKGKGRHSLESEFTTKNKEQIRNKSKESEPVKNSARNDENNKRNESSKCNSKVSDKNKQITKEKNLVRSKNSDIFDTKSPLDALYNEMVATRSTTRFTNPKSGVIKADSELEEGEFVESQLQNSENSDTSEEWSAAPKTEQPMTLYSKRMLEKMSTEHKDEKDKESKEETKVDDVGGGVGVEDLKTDKKPTKESEECEKEPGELTDDENLVESSKEFQEIAKVASSVDNKIHKKPSKGAKKDSEPERLFKEPYKLEIKNKTKEDKSEVDGKSLMTLAEKKDPFCNSVITATKEIRDIIEFSPFKNNYKLIEISPLKPPPSSEHVLDFYNRRLPSTPQTQKEVESKIFNLLVSLSGVPLNSNKTVDTAVTEGNEFKESKKEIPNGEEHKPSPIEKNETGEKIPEKVEEKEKNSNCRKSRRSSKSKQTRVHDKPEKGHEAKTKTKSSKKEDEVMESVTPGETTQFLDFFLRTTSPSKPIMPADQERENNEKLENGESDSSEKKSETNSSPTVNSSVERESPDSSQKEPQGKETNSKTKSPKLISSSKSKKEKSPSKKTSSNSKEKSKESQTEEKKREKSTESKHKKEKTTKNEEKSREEGKTDHKNKIKEDVSKERHKRKAEEKDNEKQTKESRSQKRKRTSSEQDNTKKQKLEDKKTKRDSKSESEEKSEETIKEDITSFEFFKPITTTEKIEKVHDETLNNSEEIKMTTTMSLTGVVCLETPNKCVEKFKNLMFNDQTIYQIVDSKANTSFSPLIGSKCTEMTPRRMLKNDLMLTDSDDSIKKQNEDEDEADEEEEEEEEEEGEEEGEISENGNSDFDSDSGASDFVDLL